MDYWQRQKVMQWSLAAAIVAVISVAIYWYLNVDARPDWAAEYLPKPPTTTTQLYRWQDAEGNWIVSDTPPSDGEYETVNYRSDANVVPAYETAED